MKHNVVLNEKSFLRELTLEDQDELFNLINKNREHLGEFLGWVDNTTAVSDSKSFIEFALKKGQSGAVSLAVLFEGHLAGLVSYHPIDRNNKQVALGYWIGKDFCGNGLTQMGVKYLIKNSFTELELNRIELRCAVANIASQNVADKLGFTYEGTLRQAEIINGRKLDIKVYSLLKTEWEN